SKAAAGGGAPRMDGFVCAGEFVVAADVGGHNDLAGRRFRTDHLAFAIKGANNLDAEVNVHLVAMPGRVMVKKAVVPVDPQALMAAEILPNEIERRLPGDADIASENPPPHRSQRLRTNGLGDNLISHLRMRARKINCHQTPNWRRW